MSASDAAAPLAGTSRGDAVRRRKLLVAAVLVGFVARLGFALFYWVDQPFTVDQVEYMMLADNLLDGEGLVYDAGERRLMRSPGYPVFIAVVWAIHHSVAAVKIVQSALGALTVLLVAALARRAGGARAALAAAWIAALYPPLIWTPAYMLSETLHTALALAAALLLWRALDTLPLTFGVSEGPSWLSFGVAGLACGLAVLTRPEMLIFVGLAGLLLLIRRRPIAVAALLAGALVVITPWTVHNLVSHDRFLLLSGRGGPNFWMGNNPLHPGDGDVASTPAMNDAYARIIDAHPELTPEELERVFYREGLAFVREQPAAWAVNQARKIFYFWVPIGPSYRSHSRLYWAAHAASYLSLLPFGFAGFLRLVRARPQPVVLWLLAATTLFTSFIFFPLPRYRIPLFDPVMIVCAAVWLPKEHEADSGAS